MLIIALAILNALKPFTIDLYLPAFQGIATDLKTIDPRVLLSVSIYFVGFALGQIINGPLFDRFGRKSPLYFGLVLFVLARVGCAASVMCVASGLALLILVTSRPLASQRPV